MKKFMLKYYILYLILCALLFAPIYAYTADAITEAQVEFTAGEGPTYPVNPEYPNVDGNGGESEGSFLIVSVSYFEFGSVKIGSSSQMLAIETFQPNIQVVDLRGTNTGWRVSAAVSQFTDEKDALSLPGAAIHIRRGRPNATSVSAEPVQIKDVELSTDGEYFKLLTASEGAGMGLWVMRWYPETDAEYPYVLLEIPAGSATLGSHTAEINWLLENGPSK